MPLSSDDQRRLQFKCDALETILLELIPFEVPFREVDIRQWYDARFEAVDSAEPALRTMFQEKASKVVALLATVSGSKEPDGLLELLISASTVFDEPVSVRPDIKSCCLQIIKRGCTDEWRLEQLAKTPDLNEIEARCLSASIALTAAVVEEATYCRQLKEIIRLTRKRLDYDDPFFQQATMALSAHEVA